MRGSELVLTDTSPRLHNETKQQFIYLFILSFVSSFLVFTCLYVLAVEAILLRLITHTIHSVRLLWTGDRLVAETSTWRHKTLTTDIYAPGRIRTRNPNTQAATDPRLRPRGHRVRRTSCFRYKTCLILVCGTSLCVQTWNKNNTTQWTEHVHWQSGLLPTNKPCRLCPTRYTGFIKEAWHKI